MKVELTARQAKSLLVCHLGGNDTEAREIRHRALQFAKTDLGLDLPDGIDHWDLIDQVLASGPDNTVRLIQYVI